MNTTESTVQQISTRVNFIKSEGEDYAGELYNLLLHTPYTLTAQDVCNIADDIGHEKGTCYDFRVINAIICSGILTHQDVYHILMYVHFDTQLCWLAFQYYEDSSLHMKVLKAREMRFILNGQNELLKTAQQICALSADFLATLTITPIGYSHDMPSCSTM